METLAEAMAVFSQELEEVPATTGSFLPGGREKIPQSGRTLSGSARMDSEALREWPSLVSDAPSPLFFRAKIRAKSEGTCPGSVTEPGVTATDASCDELDDGTRDNAPFPE